MIIWGDINCFSNPQIISWFYHFREKEKNAKKNIFQLNKKLILRKCKTIHTASNEPTFFKTLITWNFLKLQENLKDIVKFKKNYPKKMFKFLHQLPMSRAEAPKNPLRSIHISPVYLRKWFLAQIGNARWNLASNIHREIKHFSEIRIKDN